MCPAGSATRAREPWRRRRDDVPRRTSPRRGPAGSRPRWVSERHYKWARFRGSTVSFVTLATLGISVATILLVFLGYRAATFRAQREEETRRMGPRQL